MTEKRFQKRYVVKNKKVYDTWKEMPITDELNFDSLLNVISHLNGLGKMIDTKIEQGRYCVRKCGELKKENEQLKQTIKDLEIENEAQSNAINDLHDLLAHEDLEELFE